jgi:3D (Asp-Asp-Asp) domain-containing protein
MEAALLIVWLGSMTATAYQPIPSQTDNSPTWTSEGDRTTKYGVAVSRDLLRSGEIRYGDVLKIEGIGLRVVNDCMAERHKRRVDVLVYTHAEEKRVGVRVRQIWRIRNGNGKREKVETWHRRIQKAKREGPRP